MTKILIAIAVVVVVSVLFTLWQGDRNKEFMKTAQKTTGRVVGKDERITNPNTKRKEYWVTYSFTVGNTDYTSQELLEYPDIWMSLRPSYPVDVYYNKNNPSQCHLAAAINRRMGLADKLKR